MTVAMDDWAEAVRKAIEDDPEQPDRALLSRMLDEAMALNDGQSVAARHRHEAAEIRAAASELVAVTEAGRRLRDAVERVGPLARRE